MLLLRSAAFNLLFYALLIAIMLLGLPTMLFGRAAVLRLANLWARLSIGLLRVVCGLKVEVRGREHAPRGGCIVASKHQSFAEIIALAAEFTDFTFVLKRELTRIPVWGWYMARGGQIAVDRSKGRSAMAQLVEAARRVLADGRQVLIFPEGTRRPPGAPPSYRTGASALYAETGVPCVPVAVNSGLFWPRRSFLRRPGTIVVAFLPAIPPGMARSAFHARLRDAIESASDELMAEAVRADPGLAPGLRDAPPRPTP